MWRLIVPVLAVWIAAGCSGEAASIENDPAGSTTGPVTNSEEVVNAFENYGQQDK